MNTDQNRKDPSASLITAQFGPALRHPSTLLLLVANTIPIYGVLYWAWDVFLLLMLYGLETLIIGFWTVVRVTTLPPESFGEIPRPGTKVSPVLVATFFVVHSGIFLAAYLAFLWSEFAGAWRDKIHGPIDFIGVLIIDTQLWIPLLVQFMARGLGFFFHWLGPEFLERRLGVAFETSAPTAAPLGAVIGGFYTRIIILIVTILAGGFVARGHATITPLLVMIVIKSVADGVLQIRFDFGTAPKRTAAT